MTGLTCAAGRQSGQGVSVDAAAGGDAADDGRDALAGAVGVDPGGGHALWAGCDCVRKWSR